MEQLDVFCANSLVGNQLLSIELSESALFFSPPGVCLRTTLRFLPKYYAKSKISPLELSLSWSLIQRNYVMKYYVTVI